MKEDIWKSFWASYRSKVIESNDDLFFQVGKTINQKPINKEMFKLILKGLELDLELKKEDVLLEMCCGNGLITKPISTVVDYVYAFDFTNHLIEVAVKRRSAINISYKVGDAKRDFFQLFLFKRVPNKFLMNDSLGYFTKDDLSKIIRLINSKVDNYSFLITGIPNFNKRFNFYNTTERKEKYEKMKIKNDQFFEGMGRWWRPEELYEIGNDFGIEVKIKNQQKELSNYRMNVLFKK